MYSKITSATPCAFPISGNVDYLALVLQYSETSLFQVRRQLSQYEFRGILFQVPEFFFLECVHLHSFFMLLQWHNPNLNLFTTTSTAKILDFIDLIRSFRIAVLFILTPSGTQAELL